MIEFIKQFITKDLGVKDMHFTEWLSSLPTGFRIVLLVLFALCVHLSISAVRHFIRWFLVRKLKGGPLNKENFTRQYPKFATLSTVLVSVITFSIYFITIGYILKALRISLTTYIASASVIGLAIGFGLQGFVQDLVIGLTLIFSNTLNIGDIVEITGQIGQVDYLGLRFTVLVSLQEQKIYIPNRNIGMIGNFNRGAVRAYVDVQLLKEIDVDKAIEKIEEISKGMYEQYKPIIIEAPRSLGIHEAEWKYIRMEFLVWPGQGALIETTFKQNILTLMKGYSKDYQDWMITVVYRI